MRIFRGFTRATPLAAVVAVLLLTMPSAGAQISGSAVISAGHPGTSAQGLTEGEFVLAKRCESAPQSQGTDGYVIDLQGNPTFAVSGSSITPFSMTILYYHSACTFIQGNFNWGSNPYGPFSVPAGTRWVIVNLHHGVNVTINWQAS